MPISVENRKLYSPDWSAISLAVRDRAGWRCECDGRCGQDHGGRCRARQGQAHPVTGSKVILTVMHLDHDPRNCDPANLMAGCQKCHNRYDGPHRRANAYKTRAARKAIGDLFEGGCP